MMKKDEINLKGSFQLQVIDVVTGDVLEHYNNNNLVVTTGKTNTAKLLAGDAGGSIINKIAFGTNATTPAVTDTAITGAFTKAIDSYSFPADGKVAISWSLNADEANGININELGLITNGGSLFARKVRSTIAKTSGIRLVGTWTISIL